MTDDQNEQEARRQEERLQAYRRLFLNTDGSLKADAEIVLSDLVNFCGAAQPSSRFRADGGGIDPYGVMWAEGRREVWLRLNCFLYLDDKLIERLRGRRARGMDD